MGFFDVDWKGLAVPFAYIFTLGAMLYTFSIINRKRKAAESANLAPWFPPHLQKNVYSTLLEMKESSAEESGKEKKATKIPDSVIRAALLRRAVEDIKRIIQVRQSKQALVTLVQRGSVGDDLMTRFNRAEQEIQAELSDVVMEANALAPGWGQTIFQSANEIAANTELRQKLENIQSTTEAEKEWWEKRRADIQKDFMKELDEHTPAAAKPAAAGAIDEDGVLVDAAAPGTPGGGKKKKGKK